MERLLSWLHLPAEVVHRNWKSDVAQIVYLQSQINSGAFDTPMTQQVANRFERGLLSEKMHGQSMPKAVRTTEARDSQSGASRPKLEHICNCGRLNRVLLERERVGKPVVNGFPLAGSAK